MERKLLIITDKLGVDARAIQDFTLDLAYGSGENDFEITFEKVRLLGKERIYLDGTGYGGVVDSIEFDTKKNQPKYKGRTWQGVLNSKIIQPPRGQAYLTVSGEINEVLRSLISRLSLSSFFTVPAVYTGKNITYQFKRYVKAYDSIKEMVESFDMKLNFQYREGMVEIYAEKAETITSIDSDLMDFKIEEFKNKPNHLICLGQGELENRTVLHLYADKEGNISKTQTIRGASEYVEIYDNTGAENIEELEKGGRKRFEELLSVGKVEAELKRYGDWEIGDIVKATELETGMEVVAKISKKIIKSDQGITEIIYEIGQQGK